MAGTFLGSKRRASLAAAGLVLLGACGGGDGGTGPSNQPPRATIQIGDGGDLSLLVPGDRVEFSVDASDPDVQPLSFRWALEPASAGILSEIAPRTVRWTVAAADERVSVFCTVSDGIDSVRVNAARSFEVVTPLAGGTLAENTVWSEADSPYVLLAPVVVPSTVQLTIEPGTRVQVRPERTNSGTFSPYALTVRGDVIVGSVSGSQVRIEGGYLNYPGEFQHRGFVFEGAGTGTLENVRIRDGETGVSLSGDGTVMVRGCQVMNNTTGVLATGAGIYRVESTLLRSNGLGVQVSSASLTMEGCLVQDNLSQGIFVSSDAQGPVFTDVTSSTFSGNLGGHIRFSTTGNLVVADVERCDFFPISGVTSIQMPGPAFCALPVIQVDLRGNYWGPVAGPNDILGLIDGGECQTGISSWVNSACQDSLLADCDWSPAPFNQ